MDYPDYENSSDIEFEAAPPKQLCRRPGQASIALIQKYAAEDRINSKRTAQRLQYGRGAPSTRQAQEIWVARFNAFREFTLRKPLNLPFTGDDVLRFFDSIIDKIRPGSVHKPAPSDEIVTKAFGIISDYGRFTFSRASGYDLSPHDAVRIQTWKDDAVKAGRLTKGGWNKRVWLNFMVLSKMTRLWLDHHHKHGTDSWDIVLARHMSIVVLTSIGARGGDVARSKLYEGIEHMKFLHAELIHEGDEPKFENITVKIIVEFAKNRKSTKNDALEYYLRPLSNPAFYHMCPVALLIIHALRHGLVHGSTIEEVLQHAADAPNGRVKWLFPNYPIVSAFNNLAKKGCKLDKPAGTSQLLQTIKQMAVVSGILTRVTTHDIRLGAAQDIAHLSPAKDGSGFTTNEVHQFLGYNDASYQAGTTEGYVGRPTREFYNDRADRQYESHFGPQFSETGAHDIIKKRISEQEIQEWQQRNEPTKDDRNSRKARDRAKRGVRDERHENFIATAQPARKKIKTNDAQTVKGTKATSLAEKSISNVNIMANFGSSSTSQRNAKPIVLKMTTHRLEPDSQIAVNTTMVDPLLLDLDALDDIEVDNAELQCLHSQVLLGKENESQTADDNEDDEAARIAAEGNLDNIALAEDEHITAQQHSPQQNGICDFITIYSKINIVSKVYFARSWNDYYTGTLSFDDSIGKFSLRGHSRNDPTPFVWQCKKTPGCSFTTIRHDICTTHELHCTEEGVAKPKVERKFACISGICDKAYTTRAKLERHEREVHVFKRIPCPEGCNPEKLYESASALKSHMTRLHSGLWPTRCLVHSCECETEFNHARYYNIHLETVHGLDTRAQRTRYFPKKPAKIWKPMACPVDGCTNRTEFLSYKKFKAHIDWHGFSKDVAKAMAESGYEIEEVAVESRKRSREEAMEDDNDT
jgi:hypothetical protein